MRAAKKGLRPSSLVNQLITRENTECFDERLKLSKTNQQTKKRAKSLASLDPQLLKGHRAARFGKIEKTFLRIIFQGKSHTHSQTAQRSESTLLFAQTILQTQQIK